MSYPRMILGFSPTADPCPPVWMPTSSNPQRTSDGARTWAESGGEDTWHHPYTT